MTSTAHRTHARRTDLSGEGKAARRIVGGARRHFIAHGFRGVTMDDLADELGMSTKMPCAHFPGKKVLPGTVIAGKLARVEADLKGAA